MPEALARADYDFTVSEDPPPRRRARPRNSGRIEPTVSRVPQMQGGSLESPPVLIRFLRASIRQPLRTLVALAGAAVAVSFVANVLFMQTGPHPAPLFAGQDAARAPAGESKQSAATALPQESAAPRVVRSVPLTPEPETLPPIPPSAPRSAPPSVLSAPPAKPSEPPKAAAKQLDFDPIAQFLKTGVASAPATTASTNAASPAETKRVLAAQRALSKLGQKIEADGLMGPGTRAAIQKFERDNKLPVTGELNPRTVKALSARASIPIP
ncbi:MAG: peptidoglycan-binding domain-containing protein [Beijerinckiaceae bacterium]